MLLNQIALYRRNEHYANIPFSPLGCWGVTGVPCSVINKINAYARGKTLEKEYGVWRWQWAKIG